MKVGKLFATLDAIVLFLSILGHWDSLAVTGAVAAGAADQGPRVNTLISDREPRRRMGPQVPVPGET